MSDNVTAAPDDASAHQAAWAVSAALIALPFLLLLPIDYDRIAPLIMLPALWLGRRRGSARGTMGAFSAMDQALLLGAFAVALATSLFGTQPSASLASLSSAVFVVGSALLARRLASYPQVIPLILQGLTAGATLGCLGVWAAWNSRSSALAFPFYGHWRLFGLHLMIGTMSALALLVGTRESKSRRVLIGLAATINCGGLLWSGGRAPLVGTLMAVTVWIWATPTKSRWPTIKLIAPIVLGGLVLSLLRWTPESHLGWWSAATRTAAATTVNELTSTRLTFWRATWDAVMQSPWWGHGADAYRFLTPKLDGDQPHNWVLQYLLDFGVFGAFALAALITRQVGRGFSDRSADGAIDHVRRGVAAAAAACVVTGLLDGVFYHAVALVPAAILLGMAGSSSSQPALSARRNTFSAGSRLVATASLLVLLLHSYFVLHLRYLAPPPSPTAFAAKALRKFPSTLNGIERWIQYWRLTDDAAALDWTLWAQRHIPGPAPLHLYAAVIYADRDDFKAADAEMERALQTAHWSSRANLNHMRASIRDAASQATSSSQPPSH